jgi:hypothetical protein
LSENFHRGYHCTEAHVREMITAKLKQEDRQWQDPDPPPYREAV